MITEEEIAKALVSQCLKAQATNKCSIAELTTHITKPMFDAYFWQTGTVNVCGTKTRIIPGDHMASVTFL